MNTPWIGVRKMAVIPALVSDPTFSPPPANWVDLIRQRIFFDPDPVSGVDRSLRGYYHTVSYGKALLEAEIFGPMTIPWSWCGKAQDAAINAAPNVQNYEYACVVFPSAAVGAANPCAGWAFYNNPPFSFNPARSGINVLRNWCYVSMDASLGVWAMEVMHMITWFGDLYQTSPQMSPHPGAFDNMACSCGTQLSTFTKLKLGWLDPSSVQSATTLGATNFTLHAVALLQPAPTGEVTAVKVPKTDQHYFLVEARTRVDPYERATPGISDGIPSEGVVVYEVDETVWAPVKLLTTTALSAGQKYTNQTEQFEVEVISSVPGGFTIVVRLLGTYKKPAKALAVTPNAGGPLDFYVGGRLEVVYVGTGNVLYHDWQTSAGGAWSGEKILGTATNQGKAVAMAQNRDGRLEVVYIGTDDVLYHIWQTFPGGGWSGEKLLGTSTNQAKTLAIAPNAGGPLDFYIGGRLEVVYIGADDVLYHNSQNSAGGAWSGQKLLGTATNKAKALAMAQNADGRLEVVYSRADDDVLYHNWQAFAGGPWIGEKLLGTSTNKAKALAIAQNRGGRLEVFYVGTDEVLYHNWQTSPGGAWSGENVF